MPLLNCIENAGLHTDPSPRCEGNRFPKLAGRSDDRPSQTRGAFGLEELQPSFPPSLGKDQVHPDRLFQSNYSGAYRTRSDFSLTRDLNL